MTYERRHCEALAEKLGCELDQQKTHVTIWLPEGMQVAGNPGLDCLGNDAESMADVWPMVYRDLKSLEGGMEPLSNT